MKKVKHTIYNMPADWRDRAEVIRLAHSFTPLKNDVYLRALDYGLARLEIEVREIKEREES